jgi:type IV pilus assembly protein PilM
MTQAMRKLIERVSPRLLRGVKCHVGLHLGGDRLSAAQMELTPSGLALHTVGSLELGGPWYAMLGEPRRFKHALKRFWTEHGFRGSEVVAAMPPEQLKVFTVDYTAAQGQPDAEVIASEVKERLKGKGRSMVVDFVPVRQATQEERAREAVVAVAARDDVTGFLDFLGHAGLRVRALDIAGMALKRIVTWVDKGSGPDMQNALLVHIGAASSQLMVVWGRRLVLERSIEFSEQRLVSRVARLLDLPEHAAKRLLAEHGVQAAQGRQFGEIDAVLREIVGSELVVLKTEVSKTLHYAASKTRGNGVEKILLIGDVAGFPGIAQFLSAGLAKRVDVLDPLSTFPHRLTEEQAAELSAHCGVAVAIGLALRELPGPGL